MGGIFQIYIEPYRLAQLLFLVASQLVHVALDVQGSF
jgi:hypothetical protein